MENVHEGSYFVAITQNEKLKLLGSDREDDPSIVYLLLTENTRQGYSSYPSRPSPPFQDRAGQRAPSDPRRNKRARARRPRPLSHLFFLNQFILKEAKPNYTSWVPKARGHRSPNQACERLYRAFSLWGKEETAPLAKRK